MFSYINVLKMVVKRTVLHISRKSSVRFLTEFAICMEIIMWSFYDLVSFCLSFGLQPETRLTWKQFLQPTSHCPDHYTNQLLACLLAFDVTVNVKWNEKDTLSWSWPTKTETTFKSHVWDSSDSSHSRYVGRYFFCDKQTPVVFLNSEFGFRTVWW